MWYQRLMRFYSGPRPAETPFFMAKDRVRPYTYSAGLKDLQVMLKRVSPDDTDFTLHGVRVMNESWAGTGRRRTMPRWPKPFRNTDNDIHTHINTHTGSHKTC